MKTTESAIKTQRRIVYQLQCITPKGKCDYYIFYDNVKAFAKARNVANTMQYTKVYIVKHDPFNSADKGEIFKVKG